MATGLIIVGIAVGVVAMGGIIAYATANQQNYVSEDAVLSDAAVEGVLPKTGMLGADLNKEQQHEDPFAEKAAKIKAEFYAKNEQ